MEFLTALILPTMTNILKIFIPSVVSFLVGIVLTPVATHFFYKYRMWRRVARIDNLPKEGGFANIHDTKAEVSTPRTGGMIIWIAVIVTVCIFFIVDAVFMNQASSKLYFISRSQTVLPLGALILASLVGLGDDFLQIFGTGKWSTDPIVLRFIKIGIILALGLGIGWWFFAKLGISTLYIPWYGTIALGYLFIPFFIIVMLAVFSSSVIDGIDGLSGGVLASIFFAYTLISFFHNQINLSAFCAVVTGAILAFLWFNIPPARFYMGESGMIGLTVTLSVIAFLTDTVLLIPVIAFPLFITSLSVILQMLSRKFRNGKKVFLFAPLHHHFEALGWPKYKVTMRYWIVSIITAIIGVIISLVS
jgi:phospho-N-acetylmuramoyl-pentapeptide-transferase